MSGTDSRESIAMKVSVNTMAANTVLALGKFITGILAHSGALVSDAVHSASDVVSTIVVIIGFRLSGREADSSHPYGHERFECVCSALLAALLFVTGIAIGKNAIAGIISGAAVAVPGAPALVAAAVSIAVKEAMYRYTVRAAEKLGSPALRADAWHHRSDALSSIGSFAGILGARLGFYRADGIASAIICLFIIKVSFDIIRDALRGMVDSACDEETEAKMKDVIMSVDGVLGVDLLNTRMFGSKVYVDVEISADGKITFSDSHCIAENVHTAVENSFENVKHCMVHVNPAQENY